MALVLYFTVKYSDTKCPQRTGKFFHHLIWISQLCRERSLWGVLKMALVLEVRFNGLSIGSRCSYRPGGRLGSAGLLEGHIEAVRTWVVGVGGDGRWWREGIKGGAGLRVGRGRCDAVLRVVCVVGAGGWGAILNLLVHAVQEPQVCVLWLQDTQKPQC